MPRSRYRILDPTRPYFLTLTVNHWLPVFTRPETVGILLDSWCFLRRETGFRLHGYVVLENHVHLVAGAPDLGRDIQRSKSYTARKILDYLKENRERRMLELLRLFKREYKTCSDYQLWEEGSHPQLIESEAVMRQKLEYIHNNPMKRGYVDRPEHWRYSSARSYLGQEGLIEVDTVW